MIQGSCLCGDVAWEIDGPLQLMSHCHCSRCRKAHGATFATYVMGSADKYRLVRGREQIARWESSPGFYRDFCRRCGSVVPGDPFGDMIFLTAGNLEGDLGTKPEMHIFVGSKAPWTELHDDLSKFEGYPPGFEAPTTLETLVPRTRSTGKPRGSCLCGAVAYVVEGTPTRWWLCHCLRCRKARGAANASNLFVTADGLRFETSADLVRKYKIPEARFFTQAFCEGCGGPVPNVDQERGVAVIPAGSLDDDPGMRPQAHIFVASKAPWDVIVDDLPKYDEFPPRT